MLGGSGLVDDVDGLVRQLAVVDVAGREFHGGLHRVGGVFHAVVILEVGLQALDDLDRVLDRRLVHVDLLEPARQGAVLLEVLAELLVGGGAHGAQLAALKRGLQEVGRVHRTARSGTCADHGVDLVDEEHRVGVFLKLGHHGLQPLFEVAAIPGARQQRAHVERVDGGMRQHLRHFAGDDLAGQPLCDGGLADARVAHQQRVVLAAAAEHLDAALDLMRAADQGIDVALLRLRIQVHAVLAQGRFLVVAGGGGLCLLRFFFRFGRPLHGPRLAIGGVLGHTMGDEVHRVVAGHVLLLQEVGGIRLPLGEDRDEDIGARHLCPARGLHVDRGALDDALEGGGGHRLAALDVGHEVGQVLVDEIDERGAQLFGINGAGLHHPRGVRFVDQRQQQMLQRCKFVAARVGQGQRGMNGLLKSVRE